MTVTQIATLLNSAYRQTTGQTDITVNEDLSNVVDLGTTVFDATWKDNYVKNMIDQIGKMVFVDRPYTGYAPSVLKSDWEYGSIMAKAQTKDFQAVDNPSWALTPGQTVNQFEYNPPEVTQKFYNKREAWQIECSFAERQARSALKDATQAGAFFNMIESTIDSSRSQNMDNLIMRTFNNFMANKLYNNNGVIDVLANYNRLYDQTLTADRAFVDQAFLRYLAFTILDIKDLLKVKSKAFNMGATGYTKATPADRLHVVLNSLYGRATEVFMMADTYHNDLTKFGAYETVPFWQASSRPQLPESTIARTSINVTIGDNQTVERPWIIGIMHDEDAIAVNNTDMRVTSAYNANGEYYNNFYKCDTNCLNDLTENGVILICGSGT
jgi:hypothetical protein